MGMCCKPVPPEMKASAFTGELVLFWDKVINFETPDFKKITFKCIKYSVVLYTTPKANVMNSWWIKLLNH